MKKFLVGLIIFILIAILALSYIGVMPVLSKYFARQVDLGVKADPTLVTTFESKYAPTALNGKVSLDVNLTSAEITSIFSVWESRDKYFPLHNIQVRFNPDGTGEASGFLKLATAISLAKNLGYSDSDIEKGKTYIQFVSGDLPFYIKGTGNMTNNNLSLSPTEFKVGRVPVPESIVKLVTPIVSDAINRRFNQIGGVDIKNVDFKSGSLHLVGTVPDSINY